MTIKPRSYQLESVSATRAAFVKSKRVVLVAPTASGKSIIQALFVKEFLKKSPNKRILVLCHQGHLLSQNETKIHDICPGTEFSTGIYCASEGRKETRKQIMLASRDSLGRNPEALGKFALIIVDEAHVIDVNAGTDKSDTFYSRIFKAQDDPFIIGLTGTPWRMAGGKIYGGNKFFKVLAYEIKMDVLFSAGFLCPYKFPDGQEKVIDTSNLKIQANGDFSVKDLEEISNPEPVINRCLDIWEREASDRKVTIFFCCSRAHAKLVEKLLHLRLKSNEIIYIDGEITGNERKDTLKNIQNGQYKAIANVGVLTTGFDAPIIDCVVFLRATASVSLFLQMGGRGLRVYPDKKDCLMLDMAGNFERFGSFENPIVEDIDARAEAREKEKEEKEKENERCCKVCGEPWPQGSEQCPSCGYLNINHSDEAHTLAPKIYNVRRITLEERTTRKGDDAIVVTYHVGLNIFFNEWLLIGKKYFKQKKDIAKHELLKRGDFTVSKIKVIPDLKNPKYPEVQVLDWKKVEKSEQECQHRNVETTYSPTGNMIRFCVDCEDIV